MEYFIIQAKIVPPALGVNIFRSAATADDGTAGTASALARASSPVFALHLKKDKISAQAREIDGEFTVLEGSYARASWAGAQHTYRALHEKLVQEGVLVPAPGGTTMRFARDQVFASPSAAAAVITGRQANGRVEWNVQGSGLSFGGWQDQGIDQAAEERSPLGAIHAEPEWEMPDRRMSGHSLAGLRCINGQARRIHVEPIPSRPGLSASRKSL
jgi:hypothetical protein